MKNKILINNINLFVFDGFRIDRCSVGGNEDYYILIGYSSRS
jgi:hypothetical protein